jgi:hypothetical protein
MAIRTYVEKHKIQNQKLFEVYVHGHDHKGSRIQRKRRGIETLRQAQVIEFELKRELARLREEKSSPIWNEWVSETITTMKLSYRPLKLFLKNIGCEKCETSYQLPDGTQR